MSIATIVSVIEVASMPFLCFTGPIPLHLVERLRRDLVEAQASLVLLTNLHLLYLVTPYDLVDQVSPQPDVYFSAVSMSTLCYIISSLYFYVPNLSHSLCSLVIWTGGTDRQQRFST